MNTNSSEIRRPASPSDFINEHAAPRYVVGQEDGRVRHLLDETYISPDFDSSRFVQFGHQLLNKAGLRKPGKPLLVERPDLGEIQANKQNFITEELQISREMIRASTANPADVLAVDAYLGVRSPDDSILPPLFHRLHREAEEKEGKALPFLEWMSDYASDEQLLNVWQWNDDYLRQLDESPEFQERIKAIKREYREGEQRAIEQSLLHPDSRISDETLSAARISHTSPLSTVAAIAHGAAESDTRSIQIRETASDFTVYHELTHLSGGGFTFDFNEGTTDLRAATIYNAAHPNNPVDASKLIYGEQIKILETLEDLSGGTVNPYRLSQLAAGPDEIQNSLDLIGMVDSNIGYPLLLAASRQSQDFMEEKQGTLNSSDLRLVAEVRLRRQIELFATALPHTQPGDPLSLMREMLAPEIAERFDPATIVNGLSVILSLQKPREQQSDED